MCTHARLLLAPAALDQHLVRKLQAAHCCCMLLGVVAPVWPCFPCRMCASFSLQLACLLAGIRTCMGAEAHTTPCVCWRHEASSFCDQLGACCEHLDCSVASASSSWRQLLHEHAFLAGECAAGEPSRPTGMYRIQYAG